MTFTALSIGVVRSSQHGHEYLGLPALSDLPVKYLYASSAVVYKHLLPGLMLLPDAWKALTACSTGDKARKTGYTEPHLDISICTLPKEEKVSPLYAVFMPYQSSWVLVAPS
ncbi:MAG TPA: hypothetical protein PLP57_00470 [Candidatus Saccharicenans sp.]|nr:hypothetical protein [Candidatus Saccharicenans sp.]HRD01105.1 hypothetical protein [Candidatus Saccharicenans sp.]